MFKEALSIYGNRSYFAAETTWTSYLLANVLTKLNDPIAAKVRKAAEYELLELSLKLGRRLTERDLTGCLSFWAL